MKMPRNGDETREVWEGFRLHNLHQEKASNERMALRGYCAMYDPVRYCTILYNTPLTVPHGTHIKNLQCMTQRPGMVDTCTYTADI